jgi:hypothetical protein
MQIFISFFKLTQIGQRLEQQPLHVGDLRIRKLCIVLQPPPVDRQGQKIRGTRHE